MATLTRWERNRLYTIWMAKYGWGDIWYANPYPEGKHLTDTTALQWPNRWHVGNWTGPDVDLICVKRCDTAEEAERWLSPGGTTLHDAFRKAVAKRDEWEKQENKTSSV